MAVSMTLYKDIVGALPFNLAMTMETALGDEKPLCTDRRTLDHGGFLSNILATPMDLSPEALKQASMQIMHWRTEAGHPTQYHIECLMVPRSLGYLADEINMQEGAFNTASNNINYAGIRQLYGKIMVHPYLTDPDAWFLLTNAQRPKHWIYEPLEMSMTPDSDVRILKMQAFESYSFQMLTERFLLMSPGGSSAMQQFAEAA